MYSLPFLIITNDWVPHKSPEGFLCAWMYRSGRSYALERYSPDLVSILILSPILQNSGTLT